MPGPEEFDEDSDSEGACIEEAHANLTQFEAMLEAVQAKQHLQGLLEMRLAQVRAGVRDIQGSFDFWLCLLALV